MLRYTCKRLATGLLALYVLVTAAFFLTRMMPGSPFQGGDATEAVTAAVEEAYGLKEPLWRQYGTYLGNLLKGDLGISYKKPGVTVRQVIGRGWPATALVGFLAVVTAALFGTLLGIWQALSKRRTVRGSIFLGTLLGAGIPNFVLALLLALGFGVKLKLLPIAGLTEPAGYILPVFSLAVYPTAVITKTMCHALEDELEKEYVKMARAKGLKWRRTVVGHMLKNAWIPVLNYIGPAAAFLLTGSFAVESIFTIPGLGREFVNSIANRDYTLILGLTVFMGVVVIGVNLVTDLLCAWLNPAVRRACR
ncbi:ABC transporter permease [Bariatricus massiliensis]|uniref:ABC transporter permease n=1 Tax=Bariatricus massiliensis TaxID=1745713 RepID=A0ABS8DFC1_9FIRM|nr:ABC transporter permease [Bariatricus massiliensis]MCB7303013.1 ABC transporter permease [Bariatricus massiliensis]MCB7374229.1 ABC transporter permease [Bariatricus massiliensis]MCB7386899.1 ABC transporter permease [Bariatricus massiliensis]MCB7411061.1 ABC transporter permease [Bariatricus massiliensis]MCQ5251887.1 ABC transporter permease [Bariatricus massiliensis]